MVGFNILYMHIITSDALSAPILMWMSEALLIYYISLLAYSSVHELSLYSKFCSGSWSASSSSVCFNHMLDYVHIQNKRRTESLYFSESANGKQNFPHMATLLATLRHS